jgi:hypothetical protein
LRHRAGYCDIKYPRAAIIYSAMTEELDVRRAALPLTVSHAGVDRKHVLQ